jgi:hypothetical protein
MALSSFCGAMDVLLPESRICMFHSKRLGEVSL